MTLTTATLLTAPQRTTTMQHCSLTRYLPAAVIAALTAITSPLAAQITNHDFKIVGLGEFGGFGMSVALSNGLVAVGQSNAETRDEHGGVAYVFDTESREQLARMTPIQDEDYFGFASSLDIHQPSGLVLAGVPTIDGEFNYAGAAFVFHIETGEQLYKLTAPQQVWQGEFGASVTLDNNSIVVGSPWDYNQGRVGGVHVFDAVTGDHLRRIEPNDPAHNSGFGRSVATNDGLIAAGAFFANESGERSGSAYLFDAETGVQLIKLLPSDGAPHTNFGTSIAIGSGIVAVGAPGPRPWAQHAGAVYCFDPRTGTQLMKLQAPDGDINDGFGWSIATGNGLIVVGAPEASRCYVFDVATGELLTKLVPDKQGNVLFGESVSIEDNIIFVASHRDRGGSAYRFTLGCPADTDRNGTVDAQDITTFLDAWADGMPNADWHVDGTIDTRDLIDYLTAWAAGC